MDVTDAGSPRMIFVIRHGEKQESMSAPFGVDIEGRPDHHSLIPRGWQRAGALVELFAPLDHRPRLGIQTPDRLRSPDFGDPTDTQRRRTHQTVQPLSQRLGITIQSTFPEDQQRQLVDDILASDHGVTLVCWEHKHIPLLAQCIPTAPGTVTPSTWPDGRFDVVWRFSLRPAASPPEYAFTQLPEHLLFGDADTVISA